MPSLGGVNIFGVCVQIQHTPNPNAEQLNEFFGTSGMQSLYGGGRGRAWQIKGLLVGATESAVISAQQNIYSYADGLARAFVDNDGITWSNVVFRGEFQPDPGGIRPCNPYGYGRGYSMILRGLR